MFRRGDMYKLLLEVYFDFYIILLLNVHFPIYAWHALATIPIVFLLYNTHSHIEGQVREMTQACN